MIASVTGVGWIDRESTGWGRRYEKNPLSPEDGRLPKVTSKMIFGKGLPHFGRLDTYSKIGIAAIAFALKDAGLFDWQEKREIGIIVSTTSGCVERDMTFIESMYAHGGRFASPSLFACTLPNVFLGQAAIHLGLTGPCYCVNEDVLAGTAGLQLAFNNMLLDSPSAIIVGICDAGYPQPLESVDSVKAGAIFFVLEQEPADKSSSYGEIEINGEGIVTFNGSAITDLWMLREECLRKQGREWLKHKICAAVTGIGWIGSENMGCGRQQQENPSIDGTLPKITSRMIFGNRLPHFGRLDTYSKIGIAAIAFALKDAGLFDWQEKREIGIVAATTFGCVETDMDYLETMLPHQGRLASPNLFAYVLPNIFLGEASIHFGLTGPCYAVSEETPLSGMTTLRMALNNMHLDNAPAVIAGICDAGRPDTLDSEQNIKPGALFFVLERSPAKTSLSYGDIEIDTKGDILFRNIPVNDLQTLHHLCIAENNHPQTKTDYAQ